MRELESEFYYYRNVNNSVLPKLQVYMYYYICICELLLVLLCIQQFDCLLSTSHRFDFPYCVPKVI